MKLSSIIPVWKPEKKRIWIAFSILIICLLLTFIVCFVARKNVISRAKKEFELSCNELKIKITERLHAHAQLLRSGAAFIEHDNDISRSEWHRFYSNQMVEKNLSGMQGIGYALIIQPDNLALHEKGIRTEGFPQYNGRPEGKREIYTSIIYLEPFSGRNLRAFGYDMFTEPIRRKAMERARDYNIASLSGKVILVQETDKDIQPGTLMYVPVYKKGMASETTDERRKAIQGWVYSPYRMNDLMDGIFGGEDSVESRNICLEVFDNSTYSPDASLFDSRIEEEKNNLLSPLFTIETEISFNDHLWYLRFTKCNTGTGVLDYSKVWYAAIGGTSVSILIFILYLSLINTNTRANKLAQELTRELKDSESKYRTIFDNEIYAICIFDIETFEFLDVNEAHCKLYGYSRAEFISGMTVEDITEDINASSTAVDDAIEKGTIFIPLRYHKKKDGTIFPVEIVGGPYVWKGKTVMFALVHDITERELTAKELESYRNHLEELVKSRTAELNSANELLKREIEKDKEFEMMLKKSLEKEKELGEMKSRFISTTSHEFRTPLTTLLLSSDLLKQYGNKWTDEKKNDHFDKIKNSINYITKLLDDILTINRTESGVISYQPEMLDLHKFALECTEEAKALAKNNHRFNFSFNSAEKEFYLDMKLMKFILNNLLSNAIKFSPKGGNIDLTIYPENEHINIEVSDEGIGIPAIEIEKIFDSFYRSKNAEEIPGTGLGLAIVLRAVELHKGEIKVKSEINKGTTFLVSLPVIKNSE